MFTPMLGIYCRISRNREGQKSIKEQRLQGEEFAKRENLNFKIYIDEGLSGGGNTEKRLGFTELKKDITSGVVTSVFITNQDRTDREEVTWFELANLLIDKEASLYEDGNFIDLNDPATYFSRGVISQANALYRRITSKKIKQVLKRNVSEGKVQAVTPYGYTKDENKLMIVDEEQSEVVKRIYDLSLNGVGVNKIADIFNSEGVPTKYNKTNGTRTTINRNTKLKKVTIKDKSSIIWSGYTIHHMITNPVYKGVRIFSGAEYGAPIIIEPVLWQMVNDNLKLNRTNSGKVVDHKYLLKGLLTCGRCGRNVYGKKRINLKENSYSCSSRRIKEHNCKNRGLNIDVLEKVIWFYFIAEGRLLKLIQHHLDNLNTPDIITDINNEISVLKAKFKALDVEKSNVIGFIRKGIISEEEAKTDMNNIRVEKETIELKLYNLKQQLDSIQSNEYNLNTITSELSVSGVDVSFNDKKDILNKYIKEVVLHYDDVEHYFIEIKLNIESMEDVVLVLDKGYKQLHSIIDVYSIDFVDSLDFIHIILDEKLSKKFKDGKETEVSLMMNSKQKFEELKKAHLIK